MPGSQRAGTTTTGQAAWAHCAGDGAADTGVGDATGRAGPEDEQARLRGRRDEGRSDHAVDHRQAHREVGRHRVRGVPGLLEQPVSAPGRAAHLVVRPLRRRQHPDEVERHLTPRGLPRRPSDRAVGRGTATPSMLSAASRSSSTRSPRICRPTSPPSPARNVSSPSPTSSTAARRWAATSRSARPSATAASASRRSRDEVPTAAGSARCGAAPVLRATAGNAQRRQSPVHTTRPHRPQVGGGGSSSAALRSSSVMIRATRSDEGRASSSLSRSCAGLVRCSSRCSATTATAGPRTRGSRGRWSSPVTCTRPASRGTSLRALSVSPRGTRSQPADRARPGGTGRRSDSPPRDGRRRNVASTSLGTRLPARLRLMTRTCQARGGEHPEQGQSDSDA